MTVNASDINEGDERSMVLFDNLTRTQIVMYAGASGDYNPLHSDEVYTTEVAGYPSVFAHGMLTMGATGRLLTDWFGADRLVRYGVRFVNQVWPGDALTATAKVVAVRVADGEHLVDVDVTTTNQDGTPVITGNATARIDA
jgi:acyl dehydratase